MEPCDRVVGAVRWRWAAEQRHHKRVQPKAGSGTKEIGAVKYFPLFEFHSRVYNRGSKALMRRLLVAGKRTTQAVPDRLGTRTKAC